MSGPWADYAAPVAPRGIRNNNPLNLKANVQWAGATGTDGPFAVFDSMDAGLAAADRNLQTYHDKHGLDTVAGVVSRWAPPNADGNNTEAYVKHVADKLGVDPNAPLGLVHPETRRALSGAMAEFENGQPLPGPTEAAPWLDYADRPDDSPGPKAAAASTPMKTPLATPRKASAMPVGVPMKSDQHVSQQLGFEQGFSKPYENAGRFLKAGADKLGYEAAPWVQQIAKNLQAAQGASEAAHPEVYKAKPGKVGAFAGDVSSTAFIPGGPLVQGLASGALLSDKNDLKGVLGDAAIGGAAGRLTALGSDALQIGARKLLSKVPRIMDQPALEKAVKDAYAKVDASGFKISGADMKGLAAGVLADIRAKGGPKAARLFPDADAFAARLDALAGQKGGVAVSQLDTLRSDIYDALIKPGGKEAALGKAMRAKIDGLVDSIPNGDIKAARELYTRLSKFRTVSNRLEAADLQAGRAYTGKNTNNAIRQKLSPLVDPTSGKRIANATPDEAEALRKAVVGTRGQNLVRTAGTLLDPRGMIGMGLQLGGAAKTAGLSAASIPLGFLATAAGNRMSQKNVRALLDLIAAGGSKPALAGIPTKASATAERAIAVLRPVTVAAGAAAASRASARSTRPENR